MDSGTPFHGLSIRANERISSLLPELKSRLDALAYIPELARWLERLRSFHGPLQAIRSVGYLTGLPGYEPHPFWTTRGWGRGRPMDLVITLKSLLLFDPLFLPESRFTIVPISAIKKVSHTVGDGAVLIVRTTEGQTMKFRCVFDGDQSAIPLAKVLKRLLRAA